ncbi:MAG: hypothetical protein H6598_10875 [Flavobacteriales bacterium]|nr:hypothetical protein [Flavobacteriales bacterium]
MRYVLILLFGVSILSAFGKSRPQMDYQLIQDTIDKRVPKGKCLLTGKVFLEDQPDAGAQVCTYSQTKCVNSNKKGEFSIMIDTAELAVYASVPNENVAYFEGYKFKGGHHITVNFLVRSKDYHPMVKKPVIYLYSNVELEMELKLRTEVELAFTYPDYQDGWQLRLGPDGIFMPSDNKSYPYLFWDGIDHNRITYSRENEILIGEVVNTDTVVSYLERRLIEYGLNSKERTDFITFWGPELKQQTFAVIQFKIDEMYDEVSINLTSIEMEQRRVFMCFDQMNDYPQIELSNSQPKAKVFTRTGTYLVEWGGSMIPLGKL